MHKKYLLLLLVTVFINSENLGAEHDLSSILNSVFVKHDNMEKSIKNVEYLGHFKYWEFTPDFDTTKTIYTLRKIYAQSYDQQHYEYLEAKINGRFLSKEEISKEFKAQPEKTYTFWPFSSRYRNDYEFSYLGEDSFYSSKVSIIGFKPKKRTRHYIEGQAKILLKDSSVVEINFRPAVLPFLIKNFDAQLSYFKINNFWVPKKFYSSMRIELKFLLKLTEKFIKMEEEYSDYKFY
ncbi:MAG: hypothetical protein RMJ65_01945 [candidate division WOR-3 bacterium]|nr:hypothetical protein [candidate division WOR-3 bacterium]